MPGVVVVQIDPPDQKSSGGLYIPEVVTEDLMADIGTVVAVGEPVQHRAWENCDGTPYCHPMPNLGSRVLVLPKHGKSVEGFVRLGKKQSGFTRMYGLVGGISPWTQRGDFGGVNHANWWESVIMEVTTENFQPYGDWMLVQHELKETTEGGIILLENNDLRKTVKAKVLKVGPLCKEWKPGDTIVYHEGGCKRILGLDTAIVREAHTYCSLV